MHDAILCMMQYYAWCNIMHDAIFSRGVREMFLGQNFFGVKTFLGKNFLGSNIFLGQNFFGSNFFWVKLL